MGNDLHLGMWNGHDLGQAGLMNINEYGVNGIHQHPPLVWHFPSILKVRNDGVSGSSCQTTKGSWLLGTILQKNHTWKFHYDSWNFSASQMSR